MPVSEKQKGYSRKWDKDNMRTMRTVFVPISQMILKNTAGKRALPAPPRSSGLLKLLYKEKAEREKQGK